MHRSSTNILVTASGREAASSPTHSASPRANAWAQRLGPGFDPETLDRLLALDSQDEAGLMPRLIVVFEDSLRLQAQALAQGIQACDFDRIRRAAHTVRSSSRSLGAESFAAACLEVEQLAHALAACGPGQALPDAAHVLARAQDLEHQAQILLNQVVQARTSTAPPG